MRASRAFDAKGDAMRENLRPGEKFPDIELPDEDGRPTKLSSLMGGFPTVVVFSRGYY